jgi:hypothetical protein
MFTNRLRLEPRRPAAPPAPNSDAFMFCSTSCLPVTPDFAQWQQALYQWAYEQAREMLRPSLVERDWLGVWN